MCLDGYGQWLVHADIEWYELFPNAKEYTCYLASGGSSVVNYAMVHINDLCMIKEFWLGEKHLESDHLTLDLTLDICPHVGLVEDVVGTSAFCVNLDKNKHILVTWIVSLAILS